MSAPESDDRSLPVDPGAAPGRFGPAGNRTSPKAARPPAEPPSPDPGAPHAAERDEPAAAGPGGYGRAEAHAPAESGAAGSDGSWVVEPGSPAVAGSGGTGAAVPGAPVASEPNGSRPAERPGLVVTESAQSEAGEPGVPTAGAGRADGDPAATGHGGGPAGREPGREGGEAAPAIASGEPGLDAASEGESGETDGAVASGGPELGAADVWPSDEALDAVELDDNGWTRRNLEAILLVADEPVPAATLAELVGARLTEVEALLVDLAGEYAGQGRGFVLRAVAGGWRLYTHPAARDVVEAYLRAGQQSRLTRAALETLAVIAYRQPVTRHQVAAVRGVNVDGVFRTLATRGLIQEVGHEEGPGQAALYGTTPAFLEQLGLNSLDQLPPIKDYLPEGVDLMDLMEQM